MNIFIRKGKNYKISQYKARHNLCILHNSEIQDNKQQSKENDENIKVEMSFNYLKNLKRLYFNEISK